LLDNVCYCLVLNQTHSLSQRISIRIREGETWMEGISIRSRIILCPLSLQLYPMGFGSYFLVLLHVNTLRRKSDVGYFLGEGSWRIEKTTKKDIVEGHGGSRNDGWGHR
jgi:hypothetical protein